MKRGGRFSIASRLRINWAAAFPSWKVCAPVCLPPAINISALIRAILVGRLVDTCLRSLNALYSLIHRVLRFPQRAQQFHHILQKSRTRCPAAATRATLFSHRGQAWVRSGRGLMPGLSFCFSVCLRTPARRLQECACAPTTSTQR